MKIRSAEDLARYIDDELAWRKRELTFLQFIADKRSDRHQRDATLRAAHALLYAHFEGFTKAALQLYLNHISTQRVAIVDLHSRLAPFLPPTTLSELPEGQRSEMFEFARLIRGEVDPGRRFHVRPGVVNTGSNLNTKRFLQLTFDCGLEMGDIAADRQIVDELLLARRNAIAHGERDAVTLTEFTDVRDRILAIMDRLSTAIQNAAVQRSYLAHST